MTPSQPPPRREHPLKRLRPKPRTTVKRFAADLKERIGRASVAFDQPGQSERVDGMRYVLGIVDAALSDYDVRDPGDPITPPPRRGPEEKAEPMSEIESNVRETIARHPGYEPELEHLIGLLDAASAANAEMRRALETAAEALDLAARGAPLSAAKLAAELTRAALRAAENSPEARCGAEYGNACEGHGCPVHAGGEPESRESAPTAERAPDEPCKCGKLILQLWMEAVTESGDMGTDYRRHSRTACLTAAERASRAKAAAPPAAEGLTAAEWYDVAKVL